MDGLRESEAEYSLSEECRLVLLLVLLLVFVRLLLGFFVMLSRIVFSILVNIIKTRKKENGYQEERKINGVGYFYT